MIISKDTNPEKDLYYLGARVLEVLASMEGAKVDFISLFQAVNAKFTLSNNLFSLSLDWLFLLGLIELADHGEIKKCF